MHPVLLVGTSGYSIWYSEDLGESFKRLRSDAGLYSESCVYAITLDPSDARRALVGTDSGLYEFDLERMSFRAIDSPMNGMAVWSVAFAPENPSVVLAGSRKPAAVFRSTDGGRTWAQTDAGFPQTCPFVLTPRVTRILFQKGRPEHAWASLEIGGIWRSTNEGRSWRRSSEGLVSEDVHDLCAWGDRLFATTNRGLHISDDQGATWRHCPVDIPAPTYLRGLRPRADDSGVLFMGAGDGPPGSVGYLLRSEDQGETWAHVALPVPPQSTIYALAAHQSAPDTLFAATSLGQLYRTQDGGQTWAALSRPTGDIRSMTLAGP
jgi:photosystem II stability/assembly factor-like uncharacterized protein